MTSGDDQVISLEEAAALTECIAPLDEEGRRAVCAYWEQVIREEWVPPAERVPRAVPLGELDERRERREARRVVAAVVRLAPRRSPVDLAPVGPEAA